MKNLTDYLNTMINVGPRLTHQFNLTFVTNIPSIDSILGENINIWASGATIPGRKQNTTPISYLGYPFNVPTNMSMTQEFTFEIRCDKNMTIKDSLLAWLAAHTDPAIGSGSLGAGIKRIPTAKIIVDLYDDKMVTIQHTYEIRGVIPTSVGDISMSHENAGVAKFNFTCMGQYWDSNTINTPLFS